MKKLYRFTAVVVIAVLLAAQSRLQPASAAASAFRFVSWGDGQFQTSELGVTANQAASLHPAFTLWNGDLEQDGVTSTQMNGMVTAMGSLYGRTFLIRGNHDDHVAGSSTLWENYFRTANRPLPAGVTNYTALNSSSTYLTYSFDYGNSRFIGVDVPGDADLLTNAQAAFMDGRLTDAEAKGLTHAFIFFHGPEYCIANHCSCSAANDGSCTPGNIVNLLNKHPIVSATFHGHEHVLGWVHMDSTRVAGLTRSYEEFFTSPAGGSTNNPDIFPARVNYYYSNMGSSQGFGAVDVNGSSFTIRLYKDGVSSPVFSKTFTKVSAPVTAAFRSVAASDGSLLEAGENSNLGGALDAPGVTFALGDDGLNRQFRSILSFNTASLPDNAVISSVLLKIRQSRAGRRQSLCDARPDRSGHQAGRLCEQSRPAEWGLPGCRQPECGADDCEHLCGGLVFAGSGVGQLRLHQQGWSDAVSTAPCHG